MHEQYSGIRLQVLQKTSILMTEGKCSCVQNLKCCFLVVLVDEQLKEMSAVDRRFYFLFVVYRRTGNVEPVWESASELFLKSH